MCPAMNVEQSASVVGYFFERYGNVRADTTVSGKRICHFWRIVIMPIRMSASGRVYVIGSKSVQTFLSSNNIKLRIVVIV